MRKLIFILLISGLNSSMAQTHQWAQSYYSKPSSSTTFVLSSDGNKNVYMAGEFYDSLFIDSQKVSVGITPGSPDAYFGKFNSSGKLKWCNILYTNNFSVKIRHIQPISKNRILVYGFFNWNKLKFTSKDSLTNTGGGSIFAGFVALYDTSGKFISVVKTYTGFNYGAVYSALFDNGEFAMDKKGYFYLKFYKYKLPGLIQYKGGSIALTDSVAKDIIVKYSPNFDSVIWYKEFPKSSDFGVTRIRIGEDDNLYLACHVGGADFTLGSKTYRYKNYADKGFMSILSPKGSLIHGALINSDTTQRDNLWDIAAVDINTIYIIGWVEDSIYYQNKWYSSFNKKPQNSRYNAFPYMGVVSVSNGASWIKLPACRIGLATFTPSKTGGPGDRLAYDNSGHLYVSFEGSDSVISIGGLTYIPNYRRFWSAFVKFDKMGNALWIKPGTTSVRDMIATSDSNLVYTSSYLKDIFLDPFQFTQKSNENSIHTFIAKTNDYSIIRENVSPGPYCAGDTFRIPYYRFGKYDSSNYFIAELSDEKGNFEGGERELGRLKTTQNGSIKCTIPLFKVFSSPNYRIRIRSTGPPVQSFYKRDTLQLLIYSKDKAIPGPDESICRGDTLKLNTYGGTKWSWSPKYKMDDSTKRQPLVWPSRDTVYRIIISDSSGCGKPDTAFKRVLLRPYPKTVLGFTDTQLCAYNQIKIPAKFQGGDSNYSWGWYFATSTNSLFPYSKGSGKMSDTLTYTPNDPIEKMAIVLSDGCTAKKDTAYVKIGIRSATEIKSKINDTLVCMGTQLKWKAKASGGVSKFYRWQWKDLNNNTVLSTSDSLIYIAKQTTKIELTINDGCINLGDTQQFTIKVKPPLKAEILTDKGSLGDTTICYGQILQLSTKGKGGNGKGYSFKWYLDKNLLSTNDSIDINTLTSFSNTNQSKTLKLIISDNCTIPKDSVSRIISLLPSPKADFSTGNTCNINPIQFNFTGTKAPSPLSTSFNWDFASEGTSTAENPSQKLTSGQKQITLTTTSSNGCTDKIIKTIDVKAQAKADFMADDGCENDSAIFNNTSQAVGTINYNWRFGDGLKSNQKSPKHLYQIGGKTKTYNVSMTAVVTDGCSDSITKAVTINAAPVSNFSYTLTGSTVDLKAAQANNTSYRWLFGKNDSTTTSTINFSYTITKPEQYNVCLKVTNLANCVSETCKNLLTSVAQIPNTEAVQVFPNPNTGSFIIRIQNPKKDISITIFNLLGEKIQTVNTTTAKTNYSVELNGANGVYMVRVVNGGEVFNQRVVVSR